MLSHLKHILKLFNAAKNKHEYETKKICFHGRFSCLKLLMSVKVLYHSPTMFKFEGSGSKWHSWNPPQLYKWGLSFQKFCKKGGFRFFP